jgi:hypothetical protein
VAHSTRIAGCAETYEKRQNPATKGKPESPLEPKNSSTVTRPEKRQAFGAVECPRVLRDGEDGCIQDPAPSPRHHTLKLRESARKNGIEASDGSDGFIRSSDLPGVDPQAKSKTDLIKIQRTNAIALHSSSPTRPSNAVGKQMPTKTPTTVLQKTMSNIRAQNRTHGRSCGHIYDRRLLRIRKPHGMDCRKDCVFSLGFRVVGVIELHHPKRGGFTFPNCERVTQRNAGTHISEILVFVC